jgi:thiol:disulfide interchange protein
MSFRIASADSNTQPKLVLHFFGSSTCGECAEIKAEVLSPLQRQYPDQLDIRMHDVDTREGFQLLMRLEKQHDVTESKPTALFFPDTALLGFDAIYGNARSLVAYYLQSPEKWKATSEIPSEAPGSMDETLRSRFERFSFLAIFTAGLVDGVNPCAIATMIFLISFLAVQKRPRRDIWVIGLAFTGAVFLTYLLLGLGIFRALTALRPYRWLTEALRWVAVALAAVVGLISLLDAFRYKRTQKTGDITLQLPARVKRLIHRVIKSRLSSGKLVVGAVVTGFLVTLLEAVCTGQVYLPTIVLMTRGDAGSLRLTGWTLLLCYNALFVLPLLIVIILAAYGLRWDQLARMSRKRLSLLKIALGVVLLVLAGFLALAG